MVFSLCLAVSLLLVGALAQGFFPNPRPCTGACNVRDPGLVRRASDGQYFLFSSNSKIKYATAKALEGPWTPVGSVVPKGSIIDIAGKDDLWAPDVYHLGDKYHVYYSVSTLGSQTSAIGLATSPDMKLGSWTDHGSIGLQSDPSKPYNAIDANLFVEGDKIRMNWGSYWQNIFQADMNADGTKLTSSPKQIAYEPPAPHRMEGAYLYRWNGEYFLFLSIGFAGHYDDKRPPQGEEYRIRVCKSSSPNGGFVGPAGKPCTEGGGMIVMKSHGEVYGPGGQGVLTHPQHGPVLYYHYTNTTIGYSNSQQRFGWNPLDFSSGWPVAKP